MAVELGISNLPKLIGAILEARSESDTKALGDAAHTLKGMVATFEATEVRQLAATIEASARSGNFEAAERLVPELEEKVGAFSDELSEYADQLGSDSSVSLSN